MVVEGILVEETHRQDNQYASLVAKLRVNPPLAAKLESGRLRVLMAFAVAAKPAPASKKGRKAKPEHHQARIPPSSPPLPLQWPPLTTSCYVALKKILGTFCRMAVTATCSLGVSFWSFWRCCYVQDNAMGQQRHARSARDWPEESPVVELVDVEDSPEAADDSDADPVSPSGPPALRIPD